MCENLHSECNKQHILFRKQHILFQKQHILFQNSTFCARCYRPKTVSYLSKHQLGQYQQAFQNSTFCARYYRTERNICLSFKNLFCATITIINFYPEQHILFQNSTFYSKTAHFIPKQHILFQNSTFYSKTAHFIPKQHILFQKQHILF